MIDRDDNGLTPELRDAARLLRASADASDIWRRQLLHAIAAAPSPTASPPRAETPPAARRWSVRPVTAIAAGLVCALIGGGAVAAFVAAGGSREPARAAAASVASVASVAKVPASTPSRVRFTLVAPSATTVSIVGDFNAWNPAALPLRRSRDGRTWEIEVPLSPGRYAYSFVVDGALARDPSAPQARDDDFGSPNSVVMVRGSGS